MNSEEIYSLFNSTEEDPSWSFEETPRKETAYISHSYHRYPAKFIPQLARRLIKEYSEKDETVCDPFMGCGTTVIEALISRRKAVGVDINPVALLISTAKSNPLNPVKLEDSANKLLNNLKNETFKGNQSVLINSKLEPTIPNTERIDYWFPNENIKKELGLILSEILQTDDVKIRTFYLCAFSNILKNCSIWMMKSSKPTRDLKKQTSPPYNIFKRRLIYMINKNKEFYQTIPKPVLQSISEYKTIKKRDARDLPCDSDSVDLIVTSPPYVTSYEYADLHQLTAIWLEYAKTLTEFREGFIGSIHKREIPQTTIKSSLAVETIQKLQKNKKSKREAEGARKYFFEMQQCFEEMYRVLKSHGKACIVIGNTQLRGVQILNAEIFVDIMSNLGFEVHKIIKRKIPSKILPQTRDSKTGRFASNHKADRLSYPYEYIIILEKP